MGKKSNKCRDCGRSIAISAEICYQCATEPKKEVKKKSKFVVNDLVIIGRLKAIYKITALTKESAVLKDVSGKECLSLLSKLKFAEILKKGRKYLTTPFNGERSLCGVVKIKKSEGHRFTFNEKGKDYTSSIYEYVDITEITGKNLVENL